MINKLLILSLACALTTSLVGQNSGNQAKKDSLRIAISALEGAERLEALKQLSFIYYSENQNQQTMDSLLAVYNEMYAEAEKINDTRSLCLIKANTIMAYTDIGMYDKIIGMAPEYIEFIEKHEEWVCLYSAVYPCYSTAWLEKGESEKSIKIAGEMYEHAKARSNDDGMAAAYFQMGVAHENSGRMEDAESYVQQAINLIKDKSETSQVLPNYYFRLCNILNFQQRLNESLQAAHNCEKVVEKLQEQSIRPIPVSYWSTVWKLYSLVYAEMRDFEKSEFYLDKIDELDFGSPVLKKNNYLDRAIILGNRKEYEKALEFVNKAYETAPSYRDYIPGSTLWIKAYILSQMGRVDEAWDCLDYMVLKNDSIRNIEFNKQLDELRVIHEVDTITAQKELNKRQLGYALAGCFILLVSLGMWITYSIRLKRKNVKLALQILEQDKRSQENKAYQNEIEQLRQIAQGSIPDAEEKDAAFVQLERYMDEQQPYTNQDLNRKTLAEAVGTNEKYLRDIIKKYTDLTVNDYITLYRLKHANKLLMLPAKDYTIETIAIESGFGSRDQFHKCYRANYELTPNEFRKIIHGRQEVVEEDF